MILKKLFILSLIMCFCSFMIAGKQEKQLKIKEVTPPDLRPSLSLMCGSCQELPGDYLWVKSIVVSVYNAGGLKNDPTTVKVEFRNYFTAGSGNFSQSYPVPSIKPNETRHITTIKGFFIIRKNQHVKASVTFNTSKGPKTNTTEEWECYGPK